MEKFYLLFVPLCVVFLNVAVSAQTPKSQLDRYLDTSKTIVVAKCLEVGPPNILLKAHVEIEILFVVKGNETLRKISNISQFSMEPGRTYLLRTGNDALVDKQYFQVNTIDSAVPVWRDADIEKFKTLSPRIVVLGTMNLRVDDLECQIRQLTYELDALKAVRKDN